MYRRTGGKVGGRARGGSPVLLLTVAGRRSGLPHTVPVAYVERDGDYYLAATAGGQPRYIDQFGAQETSADDRYIERDYWLAAFPDLVTRERVRESSGAVLAETAIARSV